MIKELLAEAARQNGVDLERLTRHYDQNHENSLQEPLFAPHANSPEFQKINLDGAVDLAIARENGMLGYSYAHAYAKGEADEIQKLQDDINLLPAHRWEGIQKNTIAHFRTLCLSAHLPTLQIEFADDNSIVHPTLSAKDKETFHALFRERDVHVADLIQRNVDDGAIDGWKKNGEDFTKVTDRWREENKKIEFSSLAPGDDRDNYDADRGKSRYLRQPVAAKPLEL